MLEFTKVLNDCIKKDRKVVLVTVVNASGSSPGKPGFKMIVNENGRVYGTVGGGTSEAKAIVHAKQLLKNFARKNQTTLFETFNLDKESTSNADLCGGTVSLYYEVYSLKKKVYLFGASHVGSVTGKYLKIAGYYPVLIDDRKSILDQLDEDCYEEKIFINFSKDLPEKVKELAIESDSYVVILTHNHIFDYDVLLNIYLNYPYLKYIGMIASKSKVTDIVSKLKKEYKKIKGEEPDLTNFYSPIGLKIGGDSAAEIGLSIAAEIQAINYGKKLIHHRMEF